jgi:hypothetical protein
VLDALRQKPSLHHVSPANHQHEPARNEAAGPVQAGLEHAQKARFSRIFCEKCAKIRTKPIKTAKNLWKPMFSN